jgi:serine/threonine-protein kinase
MGQVFKARDAARPDRRHQNAAGEPAADRSAGSASGEARNVAGAEHPRICPLYDVDEHRGAYIVMQFLDSDTLAGRLARPADDYPNLDAAFRSPRHGGGPRRNRSRSQAGEHHDHAHRRERSTSGSRAQFWHALGQYDARRPPCASPAHHRRRPRDLSYMAPEQIDGREVDTRADVFAFGAVLFEMLTGMKAFEGETPAR